MRTILALGSSVLLAAMSHVIPPGREEQILQMLGKGEALPGACRLEGASVKKTIVSARYACGDSPGEVSLELRFPDASEEAPSEGERTQQFEVRAGGPVTPPPGLLRAVAEHVRAHEAGWTWVVVPEMDDPVQSTHLAGRPYRVAVLSALFALPAISVYLRGRLARRRATDFPRSMG